MPSYTYSCSVCGEFEKEHSIKEKLENCPTCLEQGNTNPVVRLISSGGSFILQGSGWAKDNYK
jgi:putative FmdB family regulatory protein